MSIDNSIKDLADTGRYHYKPEANNSLAEFLVLMGWVGLLWLILVLFA